jgi:hypothetical protein
MANCSYLFLSNTKPNPRKEKRLRHISTARYDVPFAFKVLLSGDPTAIPSSRGGSRKTFDLIGDRQVGVDRLAGFLRRIDAPYAQPVVERTLAFLNRPEHQSAYFVLDPVDVFFLSKVSHKEQMRTLIDEIANIESVFEEQLARLNEQLGPVWIGPGVEPGFIARLFGEKRRPAMQVPFPEPLYRFEQAGLCNWHEEWET